MIAATLDTLGVGKVDSVASAEEGFKLFCVDNHDVVIADWGMEPTGSVELSRKIRTNPLSPNKTAPIILMTGNIGLDRVNKARDSGVSQLLIKPFSADDLAKRIGYVLEMKSTSTQKNDAVQSS